MYVVKDSKTHWYVFTETDPRGDGFAGEVKDDVSLVDDFPEILDWPGGERPSQWLGVASQDEKDFRVFPAPIDCRSAGYIPLTTKYWVGESWREWSKTEGASSHA